MRNASGLLGLFVILIFVAVLSVPMNYENNGITKSAHLKWSQIAV